MPGMPVPARLGVEFDKGRRPSPGPAEDRDLAISSTFFVPLDFSVKISAILRIPSWRRIMPALSSNDDTDDLLDRTSWGDDGARDLLLERHRARLKSMIAVRLERRLQARFDPSDVVQEVLHEAAEHLDDYLKERPLPFHAWLREIAWKRLVDLRRKHIAAGKRSILREQPFDPGLSDESAAALADRLVASATSPSQKLLDQELRVRVREALEALPPLDREVLILRYLERLSPRETAEALGISNGAASTRHTRALARLRELLDAEQGEERR
jgi:RNA polymerase sigma-70 factor (ECF subfamily)